jgi:hypothetical protein
MEIFGLNPVLDNHTVSTTISDSPPRPIAVSTSLTNLSSFTGSPVGSTKVVPTMDADPEVMRSDIQPQTAEKRLEGLMISQGGMFPKDECVVCLTERKKVMLLPCR